MEKISKVEAKEKGLKHYFTGKVCRNGGLAPRRVSNNQCTCENCKLIKAIGDKEYSQRGYVKERELESDLENSTKKIKSFIIKDQEIGKGEIKNLFLGIPNTIEKQTKRSAKPLMKNIMKKISMSTLGGVKSIAKDLKKSHLVGMTQVKQESFTT